MSKARPIVLITAPPELAHDEIEGLYDQLTQGGYLPLFVTGKRVGVRVLSADKMRRADYKACVNAAKAILEKRHSQEP